MKTRIRFYAMAAALLAASFRFATAAPDTVKTVVITGNDTLHFSVTRIDATPGERLHVQLRNTGTLPKEVMGHNWVLLAGGENPEAYVAAAADAKASDYQPVALKAEVLAAVPVLGPGQTGDATFSAPTAPGSYIFLCSFPAHCAAGMRGVLVVK
jgi:azurin